MLEAGSVIQTDYRKQLTGIMGKRRQRQLHLPRWPRVSNLHDFLFTSRGRGLLLGSVNEKLLITFFHSGLDQRKQTGGVIVALLKIRTKKKKGIGDNQRFFFFFSTGHFLNHVTVVLLVRASKCGQSFGRSRKHGNILLVWIKAEL